jgi:glycosyltransferase involved in cell wall biosynthesis
MGRKQLLYISPRFLFPADCGGKIRPRDILRGLKRGGRFDITLVSPEPAGGSRRFADDLQSVCHRFAGWPEQERGMLSALRRYLLLMSTLPVAVASDRSAEGRRCVMSELQRKPDVVVADFAHSAVLLPKTIESPSVLFTHNIEAQIFRRQAGVESNPIYRLVWKSQAKKMQRYENAASRRFDVLVAVSESDANYFGRLCGQHRVHVIPTGVDLDYFGDQGARPESAPDGGTIVFTGSMNWGPNIDGVRYFMDEVWPRITQARPNARMLVVGHSAPKSLTQAAQTRGLSWTFTGFVDDIRVYVKRAHVYVIPLRAGGGTRIKAFEAMAMGCPVVSTSIGIEGLPLTSGRDCVVADTSEGFAAAVLKLLDDVDAGSVIAKNARILVEEHFSMNAAAASFEEACRRAMNTPAPLTETVRSAGMAPLRSA